jgi:hypothetical protein
LTHSRERRWIPSGKIPQTGAAHSRKLIFLPNLEYRSAIRTKLINDLPKGHELQILYKGDKSYRTIRPHIAFETGTGNILISVFQTEDPNNETSEPAWRDFSVKDIKDVIFSDDRFEPAKDFNPDAERYGVTISKIQFAKKDLI